MMAIEYNKERGTSRFTEVIESKMTQYLDTEVPWKTITRIERQGQKGHYDVSYRDSSCLR
jgi:hypothetical protein